jgi:cell division protein ZapA (FtsZ GTPase activity inhibitor)
MDIVYQYYNEIVLAFSSYEIEFSDGIIIIPVPLDNKPFDLVCNKIHTQLLRIADTLDAREKDILIQVKRADEIREIVLAKHES